jgi:hypothetical protein
MHAHVHMSEGIQPKLESERDITVNSPGFSVAVDIAQHIEAFGVKIPMLITQITRHNVERRGLPRMGIID